MIRNALVTSYRTIVNNRTYTFINLAGLVLGLTASFVLIVFAINEGSYNKCFPHYNRLSRVILTDSKGTMGPVGSSLLKPLLLKNLPEIKNSARVILSDFMPDKIRVIGNGKLYDVPDMICADQEIFGFLGMDLLRGSPAGSNHLKNRLFISESALHIFFNDEVRLYQKVKLIVGSTVYEMTVAGIFSNLPWNSTLKAGLITDLSFYGKMLAGSYPELIPVFNSFEDYTVETFCEFPDNTDLKAITSKLPLILQDSAWRAANLKISFQPLKDIYLGSADFQNNSHLQGSKLSVYTYSWLAVFILLLAGINYAILSTARSALRFKEIGVRKVLGATKKELRIQILIESVLLTFIAFPLALFILGLIDPRITGMPDYTVTMYASNMPDYILLFSGITILIGILSGLYVALYLAGLNPINALKAKYFSPGKFNLSKVFIGFQLFITLSLLICMITIYSQVRLCYISNLSISRDNVLLIPLKTNDFPKYSSFKSNLSRINGILSYSGTSLFSLPSRTITTVPVRVANSKKKIPVEWTRVDKDFFNTLGIPIVRGRDYDTASIHRNELECILNEEGVRAIKYKSPLGMILNGAKIVGVAKDVNLHTLHEKINPLNFLYDPYSVNTILVHYKQGMEQPVIHDIKNIWEKTYPNFPFTYSFFRQELGSVYQKENNFVIAVAVFTILAFIITGMGLFGLALLISERKTKETAVRKVFGATNFQIIYRMQKEFLVYTGLATIVAIPVSWLLMELWLKEFYYRVNISIWVMLLCVFIVTIFVSAILLLRTLKVLRSNPVNALKYE